jgi:hypothetical protein
MGDMKNRHEDTNKLLQKIRRKENILVQAIRAVDDYFYMKQMPKDMSDLRDALDKELNFNPDR